jgi:hypothetical protein
MEELEKLEQRLEIIEEKVAKVDEKLNLLIEWLDKNTEKKSIVLENDGEIMFRHKRRQDLFNVITGLNIKA